MYSLDWSEWSQFGECSKSRGGGTKNRTRVCINDILEEREYYGSPTMTLVNKYKAKNVAEGQCLHQKIKIK